MLKRSPRGGNSSLSKANFLCFSPSGSSSSASFFLDSGVSFRLFGSPVIRSISG